MYTNTYERDYEQWLNNHSVLFVYYFCDIVTTVIKVYTVMLVCHIILKIKDKKHLPFSV